MNIKLPAKPEPTEIEVELTNNCNAGCVACPREKLTAPKGYMSAEVFNTIIEKYKKYRTGLEINKYEKEPSYPFVSFAGMGEPLLHKQIFEFIRHAKSENFKTLLFTNASLLDEGKAEELVKAGIDHLNISFWGTNEEEYHNAMGLDFNTSLKNIEYFSKLASKNDISIIISWIRSKYIKSSTDDIIRFWEKRGLPVDIEDDNKAWNRGGLLSDSAFVEKFSDYPDVDYSLDIWCSQLFFTDTICWNGDVVLCSCDYYQKNNILGNLMEIYPEDIMKKKNDILREKVKIPVCLSCKKPDRNYALGSTPWDELVDQEEKTKYRYGLDNND